MHTHTTLTCRRGKLFKSGSPLRFSPGAIPFPESKRSKKGVLVVLMWATSWDCLASSVDVSHFLRLSSWKQARESLKMIQGWPPQFPLRWKGQVPSCCGTVQWISEDHQETRCTGYRHTVEDVSKWTEHVNLLLKWGLVVRIDLNKIAWFF